MSVLQALLLFCALSGAGVVGIVAVGGRAPVPACALYDFEIPDAVPVSTIVEAKHWTTTPINKGA